MKDVDIYSAVFDVSHDSMVKAGKDFHFAKDTFMYSVSNDINTVDIYELSKYTDNSTFLQLAYLMLLKRLPDQRAIEHWQDRLELPYKEFQSLVIKSLINSQEHYNNCVRAYNNIYSNHNIYGGKISQIRSSGMNMPEKILKIYRKQPEFLKKLEKKIMGVKN